MHRDGQVLLLRRAPEAYWHTVAGVVEPGETHLAAAIRELQEETGFVSTELIDLGLRQPHAIPNEMRQQYPDGLSEVIIENFAVEAPRDWEPLLNEEHDGHRWCSFNEALELLHWREAGEALRTLAARLEQ